MKTLLFLLALPAFAQVVPNVENAKLQNKPFSGSVEASLQNLGNGPFWAGWSEAARPAHEGSMCDWNNGELRGTRTSVQLEGITRIVLLVRMEAGKVSKFRVVSTECKLDAGGLPFYWLDPVPAAQSVAWLKSRAIGQQEEPSSSAMVAIALHEASVSDPVLDELASAAQPERVRSRVSFWLGNVGGSHGLQTLTRMLANDPSEKVRRDVTFGLSQSKEPGALAALIQAAKTDRMPGVRGQAIFWLAQKAGNKQAQQVVGDLVDDPDRQVKEKAVFAVSQFPNGDGVPKLIEIAKSSRDGEIRKKAMFWLGQSKDPRALAFFESVLK